jgi:hypothetical protein
MKVTDDSGDLVGRAREHDRRRDRLLERVAIALVDEELFGLIDDPVLADDGPELLP